MSPGGLDIATDVHDGHASIAVSGEIDLATVEALVAAVERSAPPGGTVEIDLREVDFMDSSGVAALNRCRRLAQELDAAFVVRCRAGSPVAQLLEWTGLVGVVDVRIEDAPA